MVELSNIDDKRVIKASWCNDSYLCYVKLFLIDRSVKAMTRNQVLASELSTYKISSNFNAFY
jgi:hypothetical protein